MYECPKERLDRLIILREIPPHLCDPDCLCWILKKNARTEKEQKTTRKASAPKFKKRK
jgi:hypothetical protein